MTQLTSQLVDQKIASSDVARKVASDTIRLRNNDRETDTAIIMERRVLMETWVILHPDLVVAEPNKYLKCSQMQQTGQPEKRKKHSRYEGYECKNWNRNWCAE